MPWHNHKNEDKLLYIVEVTLFMEIENKQGFNIEKGDLYVVKKGVNHFVSALEECLIMLIENKTTQHTAKVKSELQNRSHNN